MKLLASTNPVDIVSAILSKMSESKKVSLQGTWQTAITLMMFFVLFGTIDIRSYVQNLKDLPEAIEEIKTLRTDVDNIKAILIRNKLVNHEPEEKETATASR